MTQLHFNWGEGNEPDSTLACMACRVGSGEAPDLAAGESRDPAEAGPEVSEDIAGTDWDDDYADDLTDAMMRDGCEAWQDEESYAVCVPRFGQI